MSMLSDFLNEQSLSAADVVSASKALETYSSTDRELMVKRADARRNKKTYEEAALGKPDSLGHGVSARVLGQALDGKPVTRTTRKKIVRAVNSLLKTGKKDEVEWRQLFSDVPSRKGKAPKTKKK